MLKSLFKKKKSTNLYAPLSGEVVNIEDVPDSVFNQKMMGEGIAIKPETNEVIAPFDGEIIQLFETSHAIGLKDNHGNEVLIHIGLDTVELKGEGFTAMVKQGDKVTKGQVLISLDLDNLNKNAKDMITPIVVTNSSDNNMKIEFSNESRAIVGETILMNIDKE